MFRPLFFSLICLLLAACSAEKSADNPGGAAGVGTEVPGPFAGLGKAPAAEQRPFEITQHGQTRVDNYHWLRDDNWQALLRDPSVLKPDIEAYLLEENAYFEDATADLGDLRATLVAEMRGRIKEDDSTVPSVDGPWAYAIRYREGGEYPLVVRTPKGGGEEQVLFDGDKEGEGEAFFNVATVSHSPNHEMIAYSIDRKGSEYYDIRVRRLDSGEEFSETVGSTNGSVVWAADSRSFFYVERDDNQRPRRIRRHVLGADPTTDEVLYEEADGSYFLVIRESQSGEYLFIIGSKPTSTEVRFIALDAPAGTPPTLVAPRLEDQRYEPVHNGEHFYIITNADGAVDYKVVRAPVATPGRDHWEDWLPHREGVNVVRLIPLQDWVILLERENALPRITVSNWAQDVSYAIEFDEAAYRLGLRAGYEFDTNNLRFTYESPSTPRQTFDYDLKSRERVLRKTREVPSGHNPDLYQVERLFVEADDGARIPVTVLRLKSTPVDGSAPLLLFGYGSYGSTVSAYFSGNMLSLVDRGVIYAVGHVRGGAAMGRQWYLDGKLEHKSRSFSDFARVAEALQEKGYGVPGETVIYGGSAGGLLVGATVNLRPDLFGGVIAAVPFVDVINTISDAELPLTPREWVEWGDPINDPKAFATIAAYSPYDNIRPDVAYPPVFATGGLADYRVTYWEPAKWIARMRAEAEGGPFFLKIDMESGHSGSAARFKSLEETADYLSFALKLFGLEDAAPVSHQPTLAAE